MRVTRVRLELRAPTFATILTVLAYLGMPEVRGAAEPASKPSIRVVEGRVTDSQGRPPLQGRVFFGPQSPPAPFTASAAATLDAEGHYRVELADFPWWPAPLPASGTLRYLVLAPGSRAAVGTVEAGPGPSTVDIRLEAEPWRATDLLLTNREGVPIPGAEVAIGLGGDSLIWSRLATDGEGRCTLAMAAGQPFGIFIRREGYLPAVLGLHGAEDEPTAFRIKLHEPIRGRVVDPKGRPLPGVRVGQAIVPDFNGPNGPEPTGRTVLRPLDGMKQPATTDGEGRFVLTPTLSLSTKRLGPSGEFRTLRQSLCFTDETSRRLAFLVIDLDDPLPPLEVTLRPTRLVRIPIEHDLAVPSDRFRIGWSIGAAADAERHDVLPGGLAGHLKVMGPGGDPHAGVRIEVYCPSGNYRLKVILSDPLTSSAQRVGSAECELTVPPGEEPLDLPPVRLEATAKLRLIGQPAPEIDATDLDTGREVRLADFRGQVIVLDFWGYWCGPCVIAMPELAEVHRRFRGRPVVILGLHDQSVQSREEYDRKLAGVKHQLWEGRDLPFLVALDRPDPGRAPGEVAEGGGVTFKRYGIEFLNTRVVIDQDGRVAGLVPAQEHDRLEAKIEDLLNSRQ